GLLFPEVPIQSCGSQVRPGYTPLDSFFGRAPANPYGACLEDSVTEYLAVIFPQVRWKIRNEISHHRIPPLGQVLRYPADAKPIRMHTGTANCLNYGEGTFTIVERVKHRRHLSQILGEGAVPD